MVRDNCGAALSPATEKKLKSAYLIPLAISAAAVFCNAPAVTDSWTECRVFEFAELQSMNKAELESLYCKNTASAASSRELHRVNLEASRGFSETGNWIKSGTSLQKAGIYSNRIGACLGENVRVLRVMRKRNNKAVEPKCP
jgi:hypothetical protein